MKLLHGDCLEVLKTLDDNSVDSIVTDPPYGLGKEPDPVEVMQSWIEKGYHEIKGKGFMGKEWDAFVPQPIVWKECLRVLKPGGYILVFGGTRTQDWVAMSLRFAGFELRDTIMWVFGSGFPKSHNISKAINKLLPDSFEVKQWKGWGTSLKPAHEKILLAQKPVESSTLLLYYVIRTIQQIVEALECQLMSNAQIVELSSKLNQSVSGGVVNIAQWNAENSINIEEDLHALMVMLQSKSETTMNLNTVLLCLNTLVDLYKQMNMFTTEMASSLITDLKILNSLELVSIFQGIMLAKKTPVNGTSQHASTVQSLLNGVRIKLTYIQEHFALENVTKKVLGKDFTPNANTIILARKPFNGTVANNVLKHGTGGLNIDATRITITDGAKMARKNKIGSNGWKNSSGGLNNAALHGEPQGRWPANFIHDSSDEVLALFPETTSGTFNQASRKADNQIYGEFKGYKNPKQYSGNTGSAARFFYSSKASKKDRDEGLDGFEVNKAIFASGTGLKNNGDGTVRNQTSTIRNSHPTVKPTKLMRYLCRLITPPNGVVLDPFLGSGSTLKAAALEGFDGIGIELEREYLDIATARINAVLQPTQDDTEHTPLFAEVMS